MPGSTGGIRGGVGVTVLGTGRSEVLGALGSTPTPSSGVVVLVAGAVGAWVGVWDDGALGLGGEGGAGGSRGPDGLSIICPMVVPLPLPPTVSPLTHSKLVMKTRATRKAPSAPITTALQRSVANHGE
jgi:hypothetical protein